ncbi:peptidoglycan-binding LysM [Leisingera sp. ANG-M1]|nr:peptidoglycan-binding LysM [Leisingera sp. ANG-M1]
MVLGGVVLFQLGVFGSGEPEPGAANGGQAGGQTAADRGTFTGDGDESGQPLQNNGLSQSGDAGDSVAAAGTDQTDGAETVANAEPAAEPVAAEEPADAGGSEAVAAEEELPVTAEDETVIVPQEPADEGTGEQIALAEPADGADVAPQAALPEPDAKEEIFVLDAPELDLVRVDSEGAAVIAGRAQEGVRVLVLLDGEILEQVEVPAGGEFVSLTTIEPSADARVVSLLAEHGGQQSASDASFILAPVNPVASLEEQQSEQTAAVENAETAASVQDAPAAEDAVQDVAAAQGEETAQSEETAQESEQVAALDPEVSAAAEQPAGAEPAGQSSGAAEDAAEGTSAAEAEAPAQDAAVAAEAPVPAEDPEVASDPAAPQPQNQAVAVLRADADGIEVVQPAIPSDPELSDEVALDSISYNGTGGVELSGRARPQSRVRVYVDNAPVAELETGGDGRWNGRLDGVEPGIYTLRLDEIELISGEVVSRLETPFKREAPEALPQPGGDVSPDQPAPLVRAVTVQKGDTLWAISQEKYGSGFLYVRVFEANRGAIRNPDLIYPGQVFTIPE